MSYSVQLHRGCLAWQVPGAEAEAEAEASGALSCRSRGFASAWQQAPLSIIPFLFSLVQLDGLQPHRRRVSDSLIRIS